MSSPTPDFYLTLPDAEATAILSPNVASDARRVGEPEALAYEVNPQGPEIRANVIVVLMESMGRNFSASSARTAKS